MSMYQATCATELSRHGPLARASFVVLCVLVAACHGGIDPRAQTEPLGGSPDGATTSDTAPSSDGQGLLDVPVGGDAATLDVTPGGDVTSLDATTGADVPSPWDAGEVVPPEVGDELSLPPDTTASCDPPCASPTPVCHEGVCVECLVDADCASELLHCDPEMFWCTYGPCDDPDYPIPTAAGCVQCLNDSHCPWDKPCCDVGNKLCYVDSCGGGTPCEDMCQPPYNGCIQINGSWECVPCTEDSHCAYDQVCDLATYSCTDAPPCALSSSASCDADMDCFITFPLSIGACDEATKCCFDTTGLCDDDLAVCPVEGSSCVAILELFYGGTPPPPGLGCPYASKIDEHVCTCEPGLEPLAASKACPGGLLCVDYSLLSPPDEACGFVPPAGVGVCWGELVY